MDYKIIGFLQKRKTISVARNWDFFPGTFSQFWDLRGFRSSNTDDQSARGAAVRRRTRTAGTGRQTRRGEGSVAFSASASAVTETLVCCQIWGPGRRDEVIARSDSSWAYLI